MIFISIIVTLIYNSKNIEYFDLEEDLDLDLDLDEVLELEELEELDEDNKGKGPMNYKDPKKMKCLELIDFKRKYRSNMTLQDYTNWLLLYKDSMYNLKEYHQANLIKLLNGEKLTKDDIPYMRLTNLSNMSSKYFKNMYNKKGQLMYDNGTNPQGAIISSNYDDYSDFIPPQYIKNKWITGNKDVYKNRKHNAFSVDWYIRPNIIVGAQEEV